MNFGEKAGGYYEPAGNEIIINPKLIQMLNSAKPEEVEGALLAIGIVVLHETVHHGRDMAADPKDNMVMYNHEKLLDIINRIGASKKYMVNGKLKTYFEDSKEVIDWSIKWNQSEPGELLELLSIGRDLSAGSNAESKEIEVDVYLENALEVYPILMNNDGKKN